MPTRRPAALLILLLLLAAVPLVGPAGPAEAAALKISICHRTRSTTNPYRRISVPQSSLSRASGHKSHTGPVWTAAQPNGGAWGDIVPDGTAGGSSSVAMNFDDAGKAVYDGSTKAGSRAACRYQSAQEFVELMRAAGVADADIVADLNDQGANEDAALLAALGGTFTMANLTQLAAVSAATSPAGDVTSSSASLFGSVALAPSQTASLSFRWGTTPDLTGASQVQPAVPATFTAASGSTTVAATAGLTGLADGQTYYFRMVATTAEGTATEGTLEGQILAFTASDLTAQHITFAQPDDVALSAGSTAVAPTASSGLVVVLSSSTPSVCTTSGYVVSLIAAGTCDLSAAQPGDATHAPAVTAYRSFAVTVPAPQTISLVDPGDQPITAQPALLASASSGLAVVLGSATPSVCTVTGTMVALLAEGTCTVTADQAGDARWLPADRVARSFAVSRLGQAISFPQPPDVTLPAPPFAVSPVATSGLPVVLTSTTPAVCTVSGLTVTPLAAGQCTVVAAQAGDGVWLPSPGVSRTVHVASAPTTAPGPVPPGPVPPAPVPPAPVPPVPVPVPPPAPAGAVQSRSATSTQPDGAASTGVGALVTTGRGIGALTLAQVPPPAAPAPGVGADGHFTIAVDPSAAFDAVTLQVEDPDDATALWWDGATWRKFAGAIRTPTGWAVELTATTTPDIGDGVLLAVGETPSVRLAGADRIGTAVAASQWSHPEDGSARAVVLARDDVFADALTGGPLAAAVDGPLLLSAPTALSPPTAEEITRVLPVGGTVYLLGGHVALDEGVEHAVADLGFRIVRVEGPDRFATAVAIARFLGDPAIVMEASGRDFPDAIAAGPAAIAAGGAVLLTEGQTPHPTTTAYLAGREVRRYAVGGDAATADPSAIALVGADRQDTTAAVAESLFPAPTGVGIAAGDDFPDALVAVPVLGLAGRPLLLSGGALAARSAAYLTSRSVDIREIQVFGGEAAVSPDLVHAMQMALP